MRIIFLSIVILSLSCASGDVLRAFGMPDDCTPFSSCSFGTLNDTCAISEPIVFASQCTRLAGEGNLQLMAAVSCKTPECTIIIVLNGTCALVGLGSITAGKTFIQVPVFEMAAGTMINGTGLGYPSGGGGPGTNTIDYAVQCTQWLANLGQGASYGGGGGEPWTNGIVSSSCYGNSTFPSDFGSGATPVPDYNTGLIEYGGAGGGVVWILCNVSAVIDGVITVNGGDGSHTAYTGAYPGGGSGGSILIFGSDISGNGVLQANGGYGPGGSGGAGGGGGGGRIALWSQQQVPASLGVTATGGSHYALTPCGQNGGDGTIEFMHGSSLPFV